MTQSVKSTLLQNLWRNTIILPLKGNSNITQTTEKVKDEQLDDVKALIDLHVETKNIKTNMRGKKQNKKKTESCPIQRHSKY